MADYKATAAELASIANAIRLKGGTSSALEYPSEWISAITNLQPASGGSEITPADPTVEYKVTDSELLAIANAIRTRGGTSALLEFPTDFVSAIEAISGGGVDIVPWATGTDAQIAAMVAALDSGDLTVAETGWQIGDKRVVTLSAMEAVNVDETHAQQQVTFVLIDSGHFDLTGGGKDHFVVAQKEELSEPGKMITGTTVQNVVWRDSARRAWCNNEYYNSIPATLRPIFKQFVCVSSNGDNSNFISYNTNDYFALTAECEVWGTASRGSSHEAELLSQINYYDYAFNRKKSRGYNGSLGAWLLRTPIANNKSKYVAIKTDSYTDYYSTNQYCGIAPFGCI